MIKDCILQVLEKYRDINMASSSARETLASDIDNNIRSLVERALMEEFGVEE